MSFYYPAPHVQGMSLCILLQIRARLQRSCLTAMLSILAAPLQQASSSVMSKDTVTHALASFRSLKTPSVII